MTLDAGFLAALLEAVPAYILRADPELRIRYVSRLQPGMRLEDVIGTSIWSHVDPASLPVAQAAVARVLATGLIEVYEVVSVGPNGGTAPYEVSVTPIAEPDGRRGVCMVAVDLTTSRRSDLELRTSQEKLRLAVGATGLGLWSWSQASDELVWDDRMREISGLERPLPFPEYLETVVHPDDRELAVRAGEDAMRPGRWEAAPYRVRRPDGEFRWILMRGLSVAGPDGTVAWIHGGTLDVTAQRTLEEQARHAQRLDALGHLTAGVAHNFNNLLTVLVGTLELVAGRTGDDVAPLLAEGRRAAERARDIVGQLMTFAGQRPGSERTPIDLGAFVTEAVSLCRRTFERHVELDCAIAAELPPVLASGAEVEQIVVNLLLNARDAVLAAERSDPRIEVVVEPIAGPRSGALDATSVRVRVTDNGIGMDAATSARAFDPFFTTKGIGRGTGLGLAISFAITRELGGELACRASPGAGATFDLVLPAITRAATTAAPSPPAPVPRPPRRRARIILVDDEPAVRAVISEVLAEAGLAVEAVASGELAIARLGQAPPVDLVLLDRSMPGGPGEAYVDRIRAAAPGVRVVLFTGLGVDLALARRFDAVVAKPTTGDELLAALDPLL